MPLNWLLAFVSHANKHGQILDCLVLGYASANTIKPVASTIWSARHITLGGMSSFNSSRVFLSPRPLAETIIAQLH